MNLDELLKRVENVITVLGYFAPENKSQVDLLNAAITLRDAIENVEF